MAKANFVKAAAKDYPNAGVKKGEGYWWWKHFRGSKQISKKQPRPSQLTSSEFLSTVYSALESLEDLDNGMTDAGVADTIQGVADDIREAGEQAQENFNNMPDGLQQGDTGQMLEQRANDAEDLASQLEDIAGEIRDAAEQDEPAAFVESKIEEAQALSYDGE